MKISLYIHCTLYHNKEVKVAMRGARKGKSDVVMVGVSILLLVSRVSAHPCATQSFLSISLFLPALAGSCRIRLI